MPSDGHVVPAITAGLHCGQLDLSCWRLIDLWVVPAITAGLHCGVDGTDATALQITRWSRPSRPGSIAAAALSCAYSIQEGVVPAITAGLHCGDFTK